MAQGFSKFFNSPQHSLNILGWLIAGALLTVAVTAQLSAAWKNSLFTPVSVVEEKAYTITAAQNFLTYGYANSGWLQDFSTSSRAKDHPYVYTHMPPGPEIVTAGLLQIGGGSYLFARIVFLLLFLAGAWFYLRFGEMILRTGGLTGIGWAFLFISPLILWGHMERFIYSPWLLLAFGPLVALQNYYRTEKNVHLWFMGALALLGSFYLEYFLQAALCVSWIVLCAAQLLPIRKKHLFLFLGITVSGWVLHMVQNFFFLGAEVFWQELRLVLSNRMTGVPSKEGLAAFYQTHNIVHHGTRALDWRAWLAQLARVFAFPIWPQVVAAGLIVLGAIFLNKAEPKEKKQHTITYLVKIWLWVIAILIIPMLLFPSFAQEYTLRNAGASFYFLGIGAVVTVGMLARQIWAIFQSWRGKLMRPSWQTVAVGIVGTLALGFFTVEAVGKNISRSRRTVRMLKEKPNAPLLKLARFKGRVFATNANSVTPGFIIREAGFGVCGLDVVGKEGEIDFSRCRIAAMRRRGDYKSGKRTPEIFIFFDQPHLLPGFADKKDAGTEGRKELRRRLASRFPLVYKNKLFEVYDLRGSQRNAVEIN